MSGKRNPFDDLEYLEYGENQYQVAEEVVDRSVTPEMLREAARKAELAVSVIRDAYIDGAMLGIKAVHDALLDMMAGRRKR